MNLGLLLLLFAGPAIHFDVTDARGKQPPVAVEVGAVNEDGWYRIMVRPKGKGNAVLVWPGDSLVKPADGPGDTALIVIDSGDARALANPKVVAALAADRLLGAEPQTGLDSAALEKAIAALANNEDPFVKGVGLLAAGKPGDAIDPLGRALRERERTLTRVPSEIYPLALLYGRALLDSGKYDEAAVAFLKARNLRPSDDAARKLRSEALMKAGKPDAQ
jgi:hypothetical protein